MSQNNQILQGRTFVINQLVTPDNLTDIAREAKLRKGAITEQVDLIATGGTIAADDQLIISDTSDTTLDAPKKITVQQLFETGVGGILGTIKVDGIESRTENGPWVQPPKTYYTFEPSTFPVLQPNITMAEWNSEPVLKVTSPTSATPHGFVVGDVIEIEVSDTDATPDVVLVKDVAVVVSVTNSWEFKLLLSDAKTVWEYSTDSNGVLSGSGYRVKVEPSQDTLAWLLQVFSPSEPGPYDSEDLGIRYRKIKSVIFGSQISVENLLSEDAKIQSGYVQNNLECGGSLNVRGPTRINGDTSFRLPPNFEDGLNVRGQKTYLPISSQVFEFPGASYTVPTSVSARVFYRLSKTGVAANTGTGSTVYGTTGFPASNVSASFNWSDAIQVTGFAVPQEIISSNGATVDDSEISVVNFDFHVYVNVPGSTSTPLSSPAKVVISGGYTGGIPVGPSSINQIHVLHTAGKHFLRFSGSFVSRSIFGNESSQTPIGVQFGIITEGVDKIVVGPNGETEFGSLDSGFLFSGTTYNNFVSRSSVRNLILKP